MTLRVRVQGESIQAPHSCLGGLGLWLGAQCPCDYNAEYGIPNNLSVTCTEASLTELVPGHGGGSEWLSGMGDVQLDRNDDQPEPCLQ